ncbi:MAG TPA: tripartite tricarboxylate transporter substrate binding protein [Casimicrobiaceae bacterium]|jgi:tripartite-type tricarboxylate transporter receptor subunit TctC|nr:tripartite tricarboxylate transporter substrate binding protein [Casimicrobiaceae bacterium]
MTFIRAALLSLAAVLLPFPALAAYPDHPIKIIVPWAPGGTADQLARLVSERLTSVLGQSVIVENKPGAAGNIGADVVAKAKPDGYTLLVDLMNPHVSNPALYSNMPFRGIEDFTPIALLGYVTTTMVINPSLPVSSVAEFIAYAKAHPGQVAYASAGVGSSTHLNAAVFAQMAGIDMLHVPYKGGAPALQETIAGRTQVLFTAANITVQQAQAGKVKILATTRAKRSALLPDVPTVGETVPGYDESVWFGLFGPANLPPEITRALNTATNGIMNAPSQRKTMEDIGIDVVNDTPEQFGAIMRKDAAHYTKLIHEMNIKAE